MRKIYYATTQNVKQKARVARLTARNRATIQAAKDRPCQDCGGRYPFWVMDLDHVRGEKKFTLSGSSSRSEKNIRDEILKCDVVCANCHRQRTQERKRLRGETQTQQP